MKRFLIFLAFLLCPLVSRAQQTPITATVLDPKGNPYQFLTGSASIACPGNQAPLYNGFSVPRTYAITGGNGFGTFNLVLYDVNSITPSGCSYNFFITAGNGITTFTAPTIGGQFSATPITGTAVVNLSVPINAYAVLLPSTGGGSGPALQTNGVTNPNQAILNFKNGTNVTITSDAGGGETINATGGGGGTPGGATSQFQYNSGGSFAGAAGVTTPDGTNIDFKGPIPYADVTAFGARPVGGGASVPQSTNVSCAASTTLTFPSDPVALGFQVNDGVTVYGCGATNAMSTPGTVTVVPSEAAGETGTGVVVNSATGSSTYQYVVFARDKYGAVTAPSTAVTITNGLAALGLQSKGITSLTRSNDTVTVVTTANVLAVGGTVQIESTASRDFNGFYSVAQIDSGTQFELFSTPTDTRAQGWQTGDVASVGSPGVVTYYLGNHLSWTYSTGAWEYYVCAKRPGDSALHLIGVTKPSKSGGYQDVQFDDWGSPYMDGQTYPPYISNANCTGSSTNDPLTTTIVSINSGAMTATVANSAAQTLGSTSAIFDDGPTILAAATSVSLSGGNGGTVYIPPAPSAHAYPINSFTLLPSNITIWQAGYLALRETIQVQTGVGWFGTWGDYQTPQFGFGAGAAMEIAGSYPAIYSSGNGNTFRDIGFYTAGLVTNGGTLVVVDNPNGTNFSHVNFATGNVGSASTDYLSIPIILRDTTGTIDNAIFDTILVTTGPDQVSDKSWTPAMFITPGQNGSGAYQNVNWDVKISNSYWNRRGISTVGGLLQTDNMYSQGNITPMVVFQLANVCVTNCASFSFQNEAEDTTGEPIIAGLNFLQPSAGPLNYNVYLNFATGAGGNGPLISGQRPSSVVINGFPYLNALNTPNRDVALNGIVQSFTYAPYATTGTYVPISGKLDSLTNPVHIPSGHSFYFDMSVPTSVTATPASSGSIPAGTWYYAVNATGADGGETILSIPSTGAVTAGGGNQTVNVAWTGALGAVSYNVYRCTASCLGADGTASVGAIWYRVSLHNTGTSYSDTAAAPTQVQPPFVSGTGITIANKKGMYAPLFQCPETTAPLGVAGFDIIYCDSASHSFKVLLNGGGSTPLGGSVSSQVKYGISSNSSGTATAVDSTVCTPPSVNGQYGVGYTITGGAAAPPTCPQVGLAPRGISGTTSTDTILYSDNNNIVVYLTTVNVATSLPTPTTLGNANFFTVLQNGSATAGVTVTITPAGGWTIDGNATAVIPISTSCSIYVDPVNATDWLAACAPLGVSVGGLNTKSLTDQGPCATTDAFLYWPSATAPITCDSGITTNTSGQLSAVKFVSTVSTGTAPFTVTSTTPVANLTLSTVAQLPSGYLAPACTSTPAAGAYTPSGTANAVECLSAGTYTLPTSVTTLSNNNTIIYCSTAAAIIERGSGASGIVFSGNNSGIIGCTLDDGAFTSTARFIQISGNYDFAKNLTHQDPGATQSALPTIDLTGSATNPVVAYNQFLGAQVDPCVGVNSASTGSGTISGAVIDHNYVVNFAPTGTNYCILALQVSGSAVPNLKVTNNFISSSTTNALPIRLVGPVAENTNNQGTLVDGNYVFASARISTGYQVFGFIGVISNNYFNDGGQIVSNAMLLGDLYESTVTGNVLNVAGGYGGGINCADCVRDTFSGNTVKGVGNGSYGILINTGSAGNWFQNAVTGNSVSLSANATCYGISSNTTGAAVSYGIWTGNTCNGTSAANEFCFKFVIASSGTAVGNQINGNTCNGISGTGSIGINIVAGVTNTVVGPNLFNAVTTNITDAGTGTVQTITNSNCSSSASPAVCVSASAGSVALPTGTNPTLVVNTTAVSANSQISLTVDESLGTKLGVTCNTTLSTLLNPVVTARTAGTSFTFTIGAIIATNPACVSYTITN